MNSIKDATRFLALAATCAPSADNSQPWRVSWDGEALELTYDRARVSGRSFAPEDPATLLAMGAAIENIHQAARAIGASVNEAPASGDCFFRATISGGVLPGTPVATDHPLFSRHTNRLRFRTEPIPAPLLDWVSSQSEGSALALAINAKQDIKHLADLIGKASALRFQNREMHEILGRSLRFSPAEVSRGDGLDVSTFNLPPGGKLMMRVVRKWANMAALNRIGAYKLFANLESQTFANASSCVAIIAPPGRTGGLSAGRLLERVWIELNRQGLAVHPFYVLSDFGFRLQDKRLPASFFNPTQDLVAAVETVLGIKDPSLYMLLRVGQPAKVPPRAKRLPLEKLLDTEKVSGGATA